VFTNIIQLRVLVECSEGCNIVPPFRECSPRLAAGQQEAKGLGIVDTHIKPDLQNTHCMKSQLADRRVRLSLMGGRLVGEGGDH